jgi:hypothetical protein
MPWPIGLLLLLGAVMLVAGAKTQPSVFTLTAGKRYRFTVKVSPKLDDAGFAGFKRALELGGMQGVELSQGDDATLATYEAPPQVTSQTFHEGQQIMAMAGETLTLVNVQELSGDHALLLPGIL